MQLIGFFNSPLGPEFFAALRLFEPIPCKAKGLSSGPQSLSLLQLCEIGRLNLIRQFFIIATHSAEDN